ncbi:hypothetical protein DYD21_00025 [Rhodohalobacter sp. SW132]|uniref:hypothetical protein n=1 Tax=Rhodohalobacter sp. SW132 TaxID=2293433 RepID=UPI000E3B4626|nr:hypothetical protein [Rhodohalobacter sp. SW132]REL38381.1 hypothetical protein DYD21_00025 [Rhodohalobacter sp. SW132]
MIEKIRKSIPYLLPLVALVLVLALVLSRIIDPGSAPPEPGITISALEAGEHIGTPAEVCGTVVSADYITQSDGTPTFLNLDKPYPEPAFTGVIFGSDRHKFRSPPEEFFLNRSVCISGTIRLHNNLPQIIISDPEQISLSNHR